MFWWTKTYDSITGDLQKKVDQLYALHDHHDAQAESKRSEQSVLGFQVDEHEREKTRAKKTAAKISALLDE